MIISHVWHYHHSNGTLVFYYDRLYRKYPPVHMSCEVVDPDIPEFIEGYRLMSAPNRDDGSSVFMSLDPNSCEKIAIKLIRNDHIDIERFKRGVDILKSLKYPGIVFPKMITETGKFHAIIMKYALSGDLFFYILEHGAFTETDAIRIMWSLANAVHYIHQLNYIHNNLRPESVLLFNDEAEPFQTGITGFGLAMEVGSEMLFEPDEDDPYISPEFLEDGQATQASDIYSLGVTFYMMFTECFPHEWVEDGHETYFDGPLWDGMSKNLKNLLAQMLAEDPDDRLTSEDVINHPFFYDYTKGDGKTQLEVETRRILDSNLNNIMDEADEYIRKEGEFTDCF